MSWLLVAAVVGAVLFSLAGFVWLFWYVSRVTSAYVVRCVTAALDGDEEVRGEPEPGWPGAGTILIEYRDGIRP